MNHHLLSQVIDTPTRLTSILDLVFTNNPRLVMSTNQEVNVDFTDHNTIYINMSIYPGQVPVKSNKRTYYTTDLNNLDTRWSTPDGEERWTTYTQLMEPSNWSIDHYSIVNNGIPQRCPLCPPLPPIGNALNEVPKCPHPDSINGFSLSGIGTTKSPQVSDYVDLWLANTVEATRRAFKCKPSKIPGNKINVKASKMMRRKSKLSKRCMTSKCPIAIGKIREEISSLENLLQTSLDKVLKTKEEKILPSIKEDPSLFYSCARSFLSSKSDIGPLLDK